MPDIDWNRAKWNDPQMWPDGGEVWSTHWGSSEIQWMTVIRPRIACGLPARSVIEIAPGYGRWTRFLLDQCERPLFPPLGDALCDDLNTPKAIAEIHGLRHRACHDDGDTSIVALSDSLRLLGLLHDDVTVALDRLKPRRTVDEGRIVPLVRARAEARRLKDFAEADRIRNELASMGVVLKDFKDGTTWELAR